MDCKSTSIQARARRVLGRLLRSRVTVFLLPIGLGLFFSVLCLMWSLTSLQNIRADAKRNIYTANRLSESRINSLFSIEAERLHSAIVGKSGPADIPKGIEIWRLQGNSLVNSSASRPSLDLTSSPDSNLIRSEYSYNQALTTLWRQAGEYTDSSAAAKNPMDWIAVNLYEKSQSFLIAAPIYDAGKLAGLATESVPSKNFQDSLAERTYLVDTNSSIYLGHDKSLLTDEETKAMQSGEVMRDSLSSMAHPLIHPQAISNWVIWSSHPISEVWNLQQTRDALNYPAIFLVCIWGIVFAAVKSGQRVRNRQRRLIGNLVRRIIWITDENGTIDYVLGRITSHLGWKEIDYANVDVCLFVHPDDRETLRNAIKESHGPIPKEVNIEVRFETKEKEFRWYEVTVVDMTSIPEINGIVVTGHDIELRKHATDHILASKRAAEKANEAKSEFLSRMSHELRTPLNAILGFGQLLEMESITDRQADNVSQILIAGRHLLNLVNDILDIARIETRKVNLSVEKVNIREVVEESFALLAPLATKNNISLSFQIDDCPDVWSDRQRLKQVLLNLVSNGIKYNVMNGSVIVCATYTQDIGLDVEVIDTGIGIENHYLDRVFTPFDRLGSDNSEIEGSGLGLALSKTLVEAMGAELIVHSVHGQGSTFKVSFRPSSVVLETSDDPDIDPVYGEIYLGNPGDFRILLIEDNVVNLRYVSKVVEKTEGVVLISAKEGGVGIEMARAHRPNLILLDLDLPDISGMEVLKSLLVDEHTSSMRVVVMSAETNPHIAEECILLGADQFVTKPVDVDSLLALFTAEKKAA